MTSMLSLTDVAKTFRSPGGDRVRAVDGISMTVDAGEIVAFLGPNGAGKTTTLDMVLGLTTPDEGEIRILDRPPRRAVLDGKVAAVLQTGGLLRDLTVRETVELIASTFERAEAPARVIERAGLTDIADRRVSKCSGGEQQRLRFALALLPDPELLILDEPTAGMDVGTRREFWDTMRADAAAGRTVIFATHYLEEADAFAQRIVMVARGRLVADGSTDAIRSAHSGRTLSVDLPAAADDWLGRVRALPEVTDVRPNGTRVEISARDTDATALALLRDLDARNLEIRTADLESAFLALSAEGALDERPEGSPR